MVALSILNRASLVLVISFGLTDSFLGYLNHKLSKISSRVLLKSSVEWQINLERDQGLVGGSGGSSEGLYRAERRRFEPRPVQYFLSSPYTVRSIIVY